MQIANAFPSKYLRATDFDEPALLTIADVKMESIANDEHKPVLFFNEKPKGMVLNKTNARTLAKLYGPDTDEWNGKQVVAFSAMVDFRGDMVEAIRLRAPRKGANQPKSPTQSASLTASLPTHMDYEDPADGMNDDIPF